MKKIKMAIRAVLLGILSCLIFGAAGCDRMNLSTTNERLDSTEKQLLYRTDSMKGCDFETAYESGWLTQTDLAYAMYYARGAVYTCKKSDWKKNRVDAIRTIDFVPTEQCPMLDEQVERDIKKHYYDKMKFEDVTFEEFQQNLTFRFVGSYGGAFIITDTKTIYWDYNDNVLPPVYVAGFVWFRIHGRNLIVFKYE